MLVKAQERRVQMNQKEAETSEASSCDPTIEASDLSTSFVSLENNMSSDRHRGRAAGVAMVQRMKRFDSTSNLSKDKNKTVEKLSWNDLEVGEMLGTGGFSSVHSVSILPKSQTFALKHLKHKLWNGDTDKLTLAASDLGWVSVLMAFPSIRLLCSV